MANNYVLGKSGDREVTPKRPLIIVPCTDRKRASSGRVVRARDLSRGSAKHVAGIWARWVDESPDRLPAHDLYCGRSFREAVASTDLLNGNLMIISAGLGIISAIETIPPYGLTVSKGKPDSVADRILDIDCSPADWWKLLHAEGRRPARLLDALKSSEYSIVLMALSDTYAKLIAEDLKALPEKHAVRLRVFGLRPQNSLPKHLGPCLMPYDRRFDGPDSPCPGTLSDFASRAMAHFARGLVAGEIDGTDPASDATAVRSILTGWRHQVIPSRQRLCDEDIIAFIDREWAAVGGRSGMMLRHLRTSGHACEQGRFKDLFHRVALTRLKPRGMT